MKKSLLATAFCLMSQFAFGSDFTGVIGMRSDSSETMKTQTGYNLGALAFMDLGEKSALRAGFIYTQRSYITRSDINIKMTYFDVPVGLMYKFSELAGVFAGGVLAMNVGKECSPTSTTICSSISSSPYGFQMGISFKFLPQVGGELIYESLVDGTLMPGENNSRAAIVNLKVYFE